MSKLQTLQQLIQQVTNQLQCETHPSLCTLRDQNYRQLENMVIMELHNPSYKEAPSVQMVLAKLESEM